MKACSCESMADMMKTCSGTFRWLPLLPLAGGVVLFTVGYLLEAEVVRILWLAVSGVIVLLPLLVMIAMLVYSGGHCFRPHSPKTT